MPSSKPNVLVMGPLPVIKNNPDCGLILHRYWEETDKDEFLKKHGGYIRGVATSGTIGISSSLLCKLPNVEIISNFGVGYEQVDIPAALRRGIIVTNTPDVLTEEVADLAMGLLIGTLRRLPQATRFVREGKWKTGAFPLSPSLRGRIVGIVGLGRIGKAIARRLEASKVKVAYHGRNRQPDVPIPFYPTILELAQAVDTLILSAPGGRETRQIINANVLSALGANGVVINVSRGSLVDEAALAAALENHTILAAGLDVFADEPNVPVALLANDHVVCLPHVGSASVRTHDAMGQLVLENLLSWFKGEGPLSPVPETPWPSNDIARMLSAPPQ